MGFSKCCKSFICEVQERASVASRAFSAPAVALQQGCAGSLELVTACSATVPAEHTCDRNVRGVRARICRQPFCIEVFEELLVPRGSLSRTCAFAATLVPREPLGFCHLVGVGPDARNPRLPLLALLGREVLQACAEPVQDRRLRIVFATKNCTRLRNQPTSGFFGGCLDGLGAILHLSDQRDALHFSRSPGDVAGRARSKRGRPCW